MQGERSKSNIHELDRISDRGYLIDNPNLQKLTAWQRGQVAFDGTRLGDAVAEINRYNTRKIILSSVHDTQQIQISGVFRATEAEEFARAIAHTYQLDIQNGPDQIELKGHPRLPTRSQ